MTSNAIGIYIEIDETVFSSRYQLVEALKATTEEGRQAFLDGLTEDEFYILFS